MNVHESGGPSLREVMRSYPTGVTIVAAREEDGTPFGLTVNSFTSVSLDPPLVLVCIGHASTSHDRLISAGAFSVNILAADQGPAAGRFATDPPEGRFDGVDWVPGDVTRSPLIDGALGSLECERHEVLEGGDHSIILGRVVGTRIRDGEALVFHEGRLTSTGA